MSWLFSQALVEACSGGRSSDGEPSAPLSVMPTPHKFWRNDKTIEPSELSRFGLTCEVLTAARGKALLTSFLAGFRAKTSASPAMAPESAATGRDCGGTSRESLAKFDRVSLSWRTAQHSLFGGSVEFSETWPKWGMTRGGAAYRLRMPSGLVAHRSWITIERESGSSRSMPTPNCVGYRSDGELRILARLGLPSEEFNALTHRACRSKKRKALMRAPTPTVSGNYNRKGASKKSGDGLATFVGGSLNPTWTEWLMGWPLGWTEIRSLEMDRYQQWRRSHGDC